MWVKTQSVSLVNLDNMSEIRIDPDWGTNLGGCAVIASREDGTITHEWELGEYRSMDDAMQAIVSLYAALSLGRRVHTMR